VASPIPIRNLYYLLCYSWNRLAEGELVDVSGVDSTELADLFATVLIGGTNHLLRRGLEQGYETLEGELHSIRGRIDVAVTARRMLGAHAKAYCYYDELSVDTLPNRILKSTLRYLAGVPSLDSTLRKKLLLVHRDLGGVSDVTLTRMLFRKVQLHSNNRFYRFLLNTCELVQASWLVDEATGAYKFRDFVRDDRRMAKVFEDFVLNFYRVERPELEVKKERIYWGATSQNDPALRYLPTMETDISIRSPERTLIIDTKYYSETLQTHYETESVHSANLYQLFAYLKNLEQRGGLDAAAQGMLLYPVVDKELRLSYEMQGHTVRICTVNLARDWKEIKGELIGLILE
jgi:5-methylcytosine-specific restriction enzyme subunit McrC